jgi:hypothetical protein
MGKRFYITWSKIFRMYVCEDTLTGSIGQGLTPISSYEDCMIQLEIDTSDIHK